MQYNFLFTRIAKIKRDQKTPRLMKIGNKNSHSWLVGTEKWYHHCGKPFGSFL